MGIMNTIQAQKSNNTKLEKKGQSKQGPPKHQGRDQSEVHRIVLQSGQEEKKTLDIKNSDGKTMRDWDTTILLISDRSTENILSILAGTKENHNLLVEVPESFSGEMKNYTVHIYGVRNKDSKVVAESKVHLDPGHDTKHESTSPSNALNFEFNLLHTPPSSYSLQFSDSNMTHFIFLEDLDADENFFFSCSDSTYEFPMPLEPMKDYQLRVYRGNDLPDGKYIFSSIGRLDFRAYMTKRELRLLCDRGATFREAFFVPISHLYRNKPRLYYDNIFQRKNGIMGKYMKNDGGDQASVLNRAIQGLFFSAYLQCQPSGFFLPPLTSPFGDTRLNIPFAFFFNPCNRLYFADFFCHDINHHVTLVVTVQDSQADNFCRERLILLDPTNNPFLYFDVSSQKCFVNMAVNTEILYTENINVGRLLRERQAFLTSCQAIGASRSKSFLGRPKNESCGICNLRVN
ncbi:phytanoyl-CoA hydroxylase-interacting protein-like isoform X2 [Saccostrea cucullata]|uniref:phytanoyl-CoA hydroxylase-interacting protein-like isoform X2 n=1 Tax=Saccostrea cuccullata TaxID=36930 RepID=UPI002ED4C394